MHTCWKRVGLHCTQKPALCLSTAACPIAYSIRLATSCGLSWRRKWKQGNVYRLITLMVFTNQKRYDKKCYWKGTHLTVLAVNVRLAWTNHVLFTAPNAPLALFVLAATLGIVVGPTATTVIVMIRHNLYVYIVHGSCRKRTLIIVSKERKSLVIVIPQRRKQRSIV